MTTFTSNVLHGSLEKNDMMQLSNFSQISAWVKAQRVWRDSIELISRTAIIVPDASPGTADMIVSAYEDWTNQGKMMIESIIKYCQSRHSDRFGRSFQLIKLICADTFDESF